MSLADLVSAVRSLSPAAPPMTRLSPWARSGCGSREPPIPPICFARK